MSIVKERINYIDSIKAFCMILVVFTHVHECAGAPLGFSSLFYSVDRCAVPIFFMISGYFIINKAYKCNILEFYYKRIPRFLMAIFFCSVITNTIYFSTHGFKTKEALFDVLTTKNGIFYQGYEHAVQIWFMYPLILLYLLSPFISNIVVGQRIINILLYVFISLLFNQIKFLFSEFGYDINFLNKFGSDFTGPYVVFFILGYIIINYKPKKENITFIISTLIMLTSVFLLYEYDVKNKILSAYMHWYSTSMQIFVCSICMYFILRFIFLRLNFSILNDFGRKSFGVYLFHYAFLYIIIFIMKGKNMIWYDNMVLYFVFSIVMSYISTCILLKVKYIKNIIA